MTYKQISQIIAQMNIPYAYYQFPEGTAIAPPFICFYFDEQRGFYADNINYAKPVHLVIELYTKNKDFQLEAQLEELLSANEIAYSRYESYIDSEKMFMQTYESEVFING